MAKKFTVTFSEDELIAIWARLGESILRELDLKEKDKTTTYAFKAWKKLDKESMKL